MKDKPVCATAALTRFPAFRMNLTQFAAISSTIMRMRNISPLCCSVVNAKPITFRHSNENRSIENTITHSLAIRATCTTNNTILTLLAEHTVTYNYLHCILTLGGVLLN